MPEPEIVTVPDEVIVLVGRLAIENAMLQARLAQLPPLEVGGSTG